MNIPAYKDTTISELELVMAKAINASTRYRKTTLRQRAAFLHAMADALESSGDELLHVAMAETHLPEARLRGERARTVFQLRSYADAAAKGDWLEARINTANPGKTPPAPDIRKMLVPLGPVVIFGSSNFPFAYSTAGVDTASALAAGCPVIVKAHPAHAHTSQLVADIIDLAVKSSNMPDGVFAHVHGAAFEVGQALVKHPATKAVGFTGSFAGGKALFDIANQRKEPIPVFAEMGSVNPVFLLPGRLEVAADEIAAQYAASVTLGVGQFCTNPGLIVALAGTDLDRFTKALATAIVQVQPATMLHEGILKAFVEKRKRTLAQQGVTLLATGMESGNGHQAEATIATVKGSIFLNNPLLHLEVFGPFSMVISCENEAEMLEIAKQIEGQLTATIIATEADLENHSALLESVGEKCGRLILNGVPTGVEVCYSMHHGGPFPATTDSRFTSVGPDALRRFVRPMSFQNWPDHLLPAPLQNANPLGILRIVNDEWTREAVLLS